MVTYNYQLSKNSERVVQNFLTILIETPANFSNLEIFNDRMKSELDPEQEDKLCTPLAGRVWLFVCFDSFSFFPEPFQTLIGAVQL